MQPTRRPQIALFVVIASVGLMLLTVGAATGEDSESGVSTAGSEAAATPVRELPDRRTATSNTYLLSDGQMETRLFEVPVNYRDEEGDWQPIGEELTELPGGALTNGANSFDVHLPQDLNEAPIRVTLGEEWVSEMLIGVQTADADLQQDGTANYSAGAADFEFDGLSNGLKESIQLAGPTAPSTYRFEVDASVGVVPELAEDGSIAFRAQDDHLVAEMPAPFMVDAAGIQAPAGAVHYSLQEDGDGAWLVAVEADPVWLHAEDRSWPVVIDPSITMPSALDCVIATTTESQMCGTAGYSKLTAEANYPSAGADSFARSLLRFGLPGIPKSAYFTAASVELYSAKTATNITKVDLYDVSSYWDGKVSWTYWGDKHKAEQKWIAAGGDYGKYMPTPVSLTPAQRGGSGPGPWSFSSPDLRWLVERWHDAAIPNRGVLLRLADETPRVCCIKRNVEWESSAGTNKPYLALQYVEPASSDRKVTSPRDGTKTAKRFLLTAAWEESGVNGVTFQYKGNQGWVNVPENQVIDVDNQTVTWPYSVTKPEDRESRPLYWDASSVTEGLAAKKVSIRAILSGSPGAGGYTTPVTGEINKHLGGPKDAVTAIGPGSVDLLTGNFTISRNDISIPAFNSTLEFSRSFSSREAGVEATGVLGPGWRPASPLEEAGGSSWTKLVLKEESEVFEEEGTFTYKWAELSHAEGDVLAFEEVGNQFVTPEEMSGYVLYRNLSTGNIEFTDPDGNRTVFSNNGSGNEYLPISIAMTGGPDNRSRMIYQLIEGKRRLNKVIAPAAPGITCSDEGATTTSGCRVLSFEYKAATEWGAPPSAGQRLKRVRYYAPGLASVTDVAWFDYDTSGRLIAAWDPRISPNLKETYSYNATGQVATLTPPGQEPWTMAYGTLPGGTAIGRLTSVKRPTLVAGNPTAQTTVAYEVPLSKATGGPYDMEGKHVSQWGQKDLPTDATAVFPPDEIPASPPTGYSRATLYYMDAEGQAVNVATPSGAGTTAPSITTTETDEFGNVVRELSAQNRLRALAEPTESKALSEDLDTQFTYSKDGTELQEEKGPMHSVRETTGEPVPARFHRSIQYNNPAPGAGQAAAHLPTTETTGALLASGSIVDERSTQYVYDWTLRKPTETISDPGGSEETKSVTVYDETSGLPTEVRQPKNSSGGGAGTTKFVYYKPGTGSSCENNSFAGLLCKTEPAKQPGTAGLPQLPVKKFLSYNQLGQALEVTESPGGGSENARKLVTTYDAAGRQKTSEITGGGVPVPKVETLYSSTLGAPTTQQIVCPGSEPGCDTQATTATYDTLGRVTSYLDADGVTAKSTYDFLGRTATTDDGKGTQTLKYEAVTGLLVELEDSAAGKFTASYNADGQLVKRGLPNGLTAETTYDETGAPVGVTYTKASNCGLSCNWLNFEVERSINGQILVEDGTLGKDEYTYDKLGRLTIAKETPIGGACTTRSYKYDKDSNREEMKTTPGTLGVCSSSGGTTQKYCYDSADRLLGEATSCEGVTYDPFGRITSLPAAFAGGKTLATTYFSNNMVATQSQNGVTNTFQLDALLRQRQRLQAGGLEGSEVFHYAGPGDSPTWTQRGSVWNRSIAGISGELVATQESGKEVELPLTNLHGDVVATAALSPSATELKGAFRYDEFGVPIGGSVSRFGWLGGMQRRTELPSGVVQMGARSYIPYLGRFLTPDPIFQGAANPYDYAGQDPINKLDLSGEKFCNKVHGHEVCAGTAERLKREVTRYRQQFRQEQITAKQMARHHPSFVIRCDCKTQKDQSTFENLVSKLAGAVKGGSSRFNGAYAVVTGEGFKKAWRNVSIASAWGPDRLIQLWQCGWALGEEHGETECDPIEILNGEPESAR